MPLDQIETPPPQVENSEAILQNYQIKGTLTQEILPLVFFSRTRPLTPWFISWSRFEYKFEFAEKFEFADHPPVWPTPGDQPFSSS